MADVLRLVHEDHGQDLIEYLLLGSFVSIAALTGAQLMGTELTDWYTAMASWVSSAAGEIPTAPAGS